MGKKKPTGLLSIYSAKGFAGAMIDGSVRTRLDMVDRQTQDAIEREHGCMLSSDW